MEKENLNLPSLPVVLPFRTPYESLMFTYVVLLQQLWQRNFITARKWKKREQKVKRMCRKVARKG